MLSPSETKDLYPLMNVDDVYATLYSPGMKLYGTCGEVGYNGGRGAGAGGITQMFFHFVHINLFYPELYDTCGEVHYIEATCLR